VNGRVRWRETDHPPHRAIALADPASCEEILVQCEVCTPPHVPAALCVSNGADRRLPRSSSWRTPRPPSRGSCASPAPPRCGGRCLARWPGRSGNARSPSRMRACARPREPGCCCGACDGRPDHQDAKARAIVLIRVGDYGMLCT